MLLMRMREEVLLERQLLGVEEHYHRWDFVHMSLKVDLDKEGVLQ